jgi:hypothetical protein
MSDISIAAITGTKPAAQYSIRNCQLSVLLNFAADSTNAMSIENLRGKFDCVGVAIRAPTYIHIFF